MLDRPVAIAEFRRVILYPAPVVSALKGFKMRNSVCLARNSHRNPLAVDVLSISIYLVKAIIFTPRWGAIRLLLRICEPWF